jgi:hypothetical protein
MDIKIRKIQGDGDATKEYVILDVTRDCDIGKYLLADNSFTSKGTISNKLRHVYWFPDKSVKSGDIVYLYTGKGTASSVANANGNGTTHRFYWKLGSSVWNDDDADAAVLIKTDAWSSKSV